MSRRDRGKPPSQRGGRASSKDGGVELDLASLRRISDCQSKATIDGEELFVVVPIADPDDHMEFDRAICAAGVKKFLRPTLHSDQPNPSRAIIGADDPPPQFHSSHMLVEEITPGIRRRRPVELYPEGSLN